MKITFLIPGIRISGGIKVIFEYANRLVDRGHDVNIFYPIIPLPFGSRWCYPKAAFARIKGIFTNILLAKNFNWFDLKARLKGVPNFSSIFLPNADIVCATWWETAYDVAKCKKRNGKKFYFIQSFEIWGGDEAKVINSYRLGLRKIIISKWIGEKLKNVGVKDFAVIPNGINRKQFFPVTVKKKKNEIRVLIPYRPEYIKGMKYGIKAFKIIHEKFKNAKLVMYGINKDDGIPRYAEFYKSPSVMKLREIYSSCDIMLLPSLIEGFSLPIMEAMACKCAVVASNVGGVFELSEHGKNIIVSKPRDHLSMAQNAIRLLSNKNLLNKIKKDAFRKIAEYDWDRSVEKLEAEFMKSLS